MNKTHKPLLPRPQYLKKVYEGMALSFGLIVFSLGIGMLGYGVLGHLGVVDSLLNASMILTGMGPVDNLKTDAAKIFASFYAIYSGVAFLTIIAVLFGPLYHRFLHKFHLDITEADEADGDKS
jgi:hypothetical protein